VFARGLKCRTSDSDSCGCHSHQPTRAGIGVRMGLSCIPRKGFFFAITELIIVMYVFQGKPFMSLTVVSCCFHDNVWSKNVTFLYYSDRKLARYSQKSSSRSQEIYLFNWI